MGALPSSPMPYVSRPAVPAVFAAWCHRSGASTRLYCCFTSYCCLVAFIVASSPIAAATSPHRAPGGSLRRHARARAVAWRRCALFVHSCFRRGGGGAALFAYALRLSSCCLCRFCCLVPPLWRHHPPLRCSLACLVFANAFHSTAGWSARLFGVYLSSLRNHLHCILSCLVGFARLFGVCRPEISL